MDPMEQRGQTAMTPYGSEMALKGCLRQPSVTERLKMRKDGLEKELADVNAALDALQKSPAVAAIFDQVSRVIH